MSYISLDSFKSNVKDVARPNRFRVDLLVDPRLWAYLQESSFITTYDGAIASANPFNIPYFAKAASLPQRTIGAIEYKRYGTTVKYIGDPVIEDIDVTFINDENMVCRRLMDGWMEQCASQIGNRRHMSSLTTNSIMIIWQLGRDSIPIRGYQFADVWPKAMAASDLNSESSDVASEFVTTFSFSYWRVLPNPLLTVGGIF